MDSKGNVYGGGPQRAATLREVKSNGGRRRVGRPRANTATARLRQLLDRASRRPQLTGDDGELIRIDNLPYHVVIVDTDLEQEADR
jgi:hypothetical protein